MAVFLCGRFSSIKGPFSSFKYLVSDSFISAMEMTCRAPRASVCGGGSTLSEYEIYFNYARQKYPETVVLRPLMWANGAAPGMLFWPSSGEIESDGPKANWRGHRQAEVAEVLDKQILADTLQGYDFVGYHSYAKRRYFELVHSTSASFT